MTWTLASVFVVECLVFGLAMLPGALFWEITYLAPLVPSLGDELKLAAVQGAVVGGGLTVIANAPNPAGQALLGRFFDGAILPIGLLAGAPADSDRRDRVSSAVTSMLCDVTVSALSRILPERQLTPRNGSMLSPGQ